MVTIFALAGLVACGGTEPGNPTAADPTGETSAEPTTGRTSSAPSPTSSTENSALAALDPCALLSAADLDASGFTGSGQRDDLLDVVRCVWSQPGRSARVLLAPATAMGDTSNGNATKVEDLTIGSHSGRRVEESSGPGFCEYDLVVSDESHATVAVLVNGDTPQACAAAQQLVTIVEPKLP